MTSFYCPAVSELYGSLKCAFWLLTRKFCLLDDVLLFNSDLCMIADHDLVFGRCHNNEPHSSGILLCREVVVGYEKPSFYGPCIHRPPCPYDWIVMHGRFSTEFHLCWATTWWMRPVTRKLHALSHSPAFYDRFFDFYSSELRCSALSLSLSGKLCQRKIFNASRAWLLFQNLPDQVCLSKKNLDTVSRLARTCTTFTRVKLCWKTTCSLRPLLAADSQKCYDTYANAFWSLFTFSMQIILYE